MLERQMMLRKHRNQIQSASQRAYNVARDAATCASNPPFVLKNLTAAWRATYRAELVCDHYYYEAYNRRANELEMK